MALERGRRLLVDDPRPRARGVILGNSIRDSITFDSWTDFSSGNFLRRAASCLASLTKCQGILLCPVFRLLV
jgi:hypothetical protein